MSFSKTLFLRRLTVIFKHEIVSQNLGPGSCFAWRLFLANLLAQVAVLVAVQPDFSQRWQKSFLRQRRRQVLHALVAQFVEACR